jgi:nitroreductase
MLGSVESNWEGDLGMIVDEAMHARRSIRRFESQEVSRQVIEQVLDLTRYAPSAMNGQPWRFLVIEDSDTKRKLARIKESRCPPEKRAFAAGYVKNAPVVVAVCVESLRSYDRAIENGVLAAGFLMLAATSRGLGSVYLSAYRDQDPDLSREISEVLELPQDVEPIALIPLGYAAETPAPRELRPLQDLIRYV